MRIAVSVPSCVLAGAGGVIAIIATSFYMSISLMLATVTKAVADTAQVSALFKVLHLLRITVFEGQKVDMQAFEAIVCYNIFYT